MDDGGGSARPGLPPLAGGAYGSGQARRAPARSGDESERAGLLLRLSDLDRQLKWSRAHAAERSEDELHACRVGIAELHRQLDTIRSSESWRLGNGFARTVLTVGRPVIMVSTRLRRAWRWRSANRYRVYRQGVSVGSSLATPGNIAPGRITDERDRAPLGSVVDALRQVRTDGPRLLEPDELDALRRAVTSTRQERELGDRARDLLALLEPFGPNDSTGRGSGSLVIDVRALQIPVKCGTKTHAEHVVRVVCSAAPRKTPILMLRSPTLPDLPPQLAALFDGRFVPDTTPLEDVSAFLQLMTFTRGGDRHDFDLLRAPWIRRAVVWLDAIMGRYP
jgi:hypothetical protein